MSAKLYRYISLPVLSVLAAAAAWGAGANTAAAAAGVCADDGGKLPKECTKEIRVYNNTPGRIWVVLQASIQLTDAVACPRGSAKGGGDVWLQVALGKTDDCYAVKSNYYAFINGGGGVAKNDFVSIEVPWWSKRKVSDKGDKYIDWWRGARVIVFDDRTAFNEIFNELKGNPRVPYRAGSPRPDCGKGMAKNACKNVLAYEVTPKAEIAPHLPFQLNEFTFADVCKVEPNGAFEPICEGANPGGFIDFNQNYNVSNVDQVYLPLALEPIRKPATVGYMGTTMTVEDFREKLEAFTKADKRPNSPDWPVYNNPKSGSKKMYPSAGIRVPSAQSVLAYYMNPTNFPDGKTPTIIPKKQPKLVEDMVDQWRDCTKKNPENCNKKQAELYDSVDDAFKANYKKYVQKCSDIPDFLKPAGGGNRPKMTAYLTYIYGWVPFNEKCANEELPVAQTPPPASRALLNYFEMQYNFEQMPNDKQRPKWFNPYTQLVHADANDGGLEAAAYAFSIDDHASFLSNNGGSTAGGLIFTVGGPKGLVNGKRHAPPTPTVYRWYGFSVGLGAPDKNGPYWEKYGICSDKPDTPFPTEEKGGFVFGIDPARTRINENNPCPITLKDTAGRKYQFIIKQATAPGNTLPQKPIWPKYTPRGARQYNPNVLSCPDKKGTNWVAPGKWCEYTVQLANPNPNGLSNPLRQFEISVRAPLPK